MPFYLATVTLVPTSGVAADATENTYAFSGSNASADPGVIATLLDSLYDSLVGIYPSIVATSGHTISVINLDDPQPRYPVLIQAYSFPSAPTGNTAARELAICSSFQANRQSGIPQSRRRGRVYLGPIDATVIDNNGLIASGSITTVVNAFSAFDTAADASTVVWSVYSRVEGDLYAITNGWVDNAPDIQRRRGTAATSRTTWS